MTGPYQYPESFPRQPYPQPGAPPAPGQPAPPPLYAQPYPEGPGPTYPGVLPPPKAYPKRRRWRLLLIAVAAVVVIAGIVAAIVLTARNSTAGETTPLSDAQAKAAIQEYLTALTSGDDETIARHTLCGLYDEVKERRSDLAVAGLASDAFRKQFSRAEVTSIDKVVSWSQNQAQVLFSMRVAPAGGSSRSPQPKDEEQGVAQLLIQPHVKDHPVLVCSYLLRTGQY